MGSYPNQELSYAHIVLGEGVLAVAKNCTAQRIDTDLWIEWDTSLPDGNSSPQDKTLIGLYNPLRNSSLIFLRQNERRDGIALCPLPIEWCDDLLHCYFGFQNSAESLCSNVVWVEVKD